jgi:hypothetical protein
MQILRRFAPQNDQLSLRSRWSLREKASLAYGSKEEFSLRSNRHGWSHALTVAYGSEERKAEVVAIALKQAHSNKFEWGARTRSTRGSGGLRQ